jgi:hypothetical protein
MQLGSMFIIAVNNKHTAKLQHVGSLYILPYDVRKIKHKIFRIVQKCRNSVRFLESFGFFSSSWCFIQTFVATRTKYIHIFVLPFWPH